MLFCSLLLTSSLTWANEQDSNYYLLPVTEIESPTPVVRLRSIHSEAIVSEQALRRQVGFSLLPAINTIPGVQMEERSPGSYRLSIRGSSLRSPFGVRNVKIYLNDLPFSDAGGNTYLNSLDISQLQKLRVLKGPEGSTFGAITGGVLLIDPHPSTKDSFSTSAGLSAGSFGLWHQHFQVQQQWKKVSAGFTQAFQQAEGYRENSAMRRAYFQGNAKWQYRPNASLKGLLLFSDLQYQTPGGLTLEQFEQNPASARPPTPNASGAAEQKAGIFNKTLFGGLTNDAKINDRLRMVNSFSGSYTSFENPFISNYEFRKEWTLSARSYVDWLAIDRQNIVLKVQAGGEWQRTASSIENYGNNKGKKDSLQAASQIRAQQGFLYGRALADIGQKTLIELAFSGNLFGYSYRDNYPKSSEDFQSTTFQPQLLPRLAISYLFHPQFAVRAAFGMGYSPPTIAEVRASDNIINTQLQPERGNILELGIKWKDKKELFRLELTGYFFRMNSAIVRRLSFEGNESFVNAGGTKQAGIEAQFALNPVQKNTGWLRKIELQSNLTYHHFRFHQYVVSNADFSRNRLTGSPDYIFVESLDIHFAQGLSWFVQHNYSSSIPLNDANSVSATPYHLLQSKLNWRGSIQKLDLHFFLGIDNILNSTYSLGNDLNAFGGRFYNAAPPRNYYGGVSFSWR